MSKKNILITGANGQLGNEMRRISEVDDNNYLFTDIEELDITNLSEIRKTIKENNINIIVNCVAYNKVDKAEDEAGLADALNNKAVSNLAISCKEYEATLIHLSTDYVFDGSNNIPYTEKDMTLPIGIYGKTKLGGERSVIDSGCNYIIIRTSWLYSEWGENFVKTILQLTREHDSLSVIFDQIGTPTYAGDLANAIVKAINSEKLSEAGIYHYSNEGVCSWYDFACEINEISGNKCKIFPIHSYEYPSRVSRPHYSVLDKTKFKEVFDITIPYWKKSLGKCLKKIM